MEDSVNVTARGFPYWIPGAVIPLFTATDPFNQSFARIINGSDGDGTITVQATDDTGTVRGQFTLPIGAKQVLHFNSMTWRTAMPARVLPESATVTVIGG